MKERIEELYKKNQDTKMTHEQILSSPTSWDSDQGRAMEMAELKLQVPPAKEICMVTRPSKHSDSTSVLEITLARGNRKS